MSRSTRCRQSHASTPVKVAAGLHSLSIELLDYIVSFLYNSRYRDFKALTALSLQSKSWSALVRPYIFRSIRLDSNRRTRQLAQRLLEYPAMHFWIRELRIQWPAKRFNFWMILAGQSSLKIQRFLKLESLYFDTVRVPFISSLCENAGWKAALARGLAKLPTVRELHIMTSNMDRDLVMCLMHCLPSLRSFSASGHSLNVAFEPDPLTYGAAPQLSHACLYSIPTCFQFFPLVQGVHSLRLEFDRYEYSVEGHASMVAAWNLETLRSVRTLTLGRVYAAEGELSEGDCLFVLRRLKELLVEELILEGNFRNPAAMKQFSELDAALTFPGFPSLKSIQFTHRGRRDVAEDGVQKLREVLPALKTRDKVVVKVVNMGVIRS